MLEHFFNGEIIFKKLLMFSLEFVFLIFIFALFVPRRRIALICRGIIIARWFVNLIFKVSILIAIIIIIVVVVTIVVIVIVESRISPIAIRADESRVDGSFSEIRASDLDCFPAESPPAIPTNDQPLRGYLGAETRGRGGGVDVQDPAALDH